MPQSQKQYSNNARVHYTVHNQPTHTHNPTPPNNSEAEPQARQPGRTTPEPRQHATPHTHKARKGHPPPADHHDHNSRNGPPPQRACLLCQHRQPTTPASNTPTRHDQLPLFRKNSPQPAQTHQQPRQPRPGSHPHTIPILRKEVIQPHLPVRLPCYDFVPIANPTFDHSPR